MTTFPSTLHRSAITLLAAGFGLLAGPPAAPAALAPPFRVAASGVPIDVDIGHAAPLMADFDGDGLRDLLVGQFGNGKLRLFRNRGTEKAPEFATFAWFQAGGADARVPAG